MSIIIGVKLKNYHKMYYFDPQGVAYAEGDGVIVETAKGIEFATVHLPNSEVDESKIVSPLKPVMRKASEKDLMQLADNEEKSRYALTVAKEKVAAHKLEMKLIDCSYTFDRAKVVISFTAERRIDFRELVKDLASVLRVRIELRQIYERDECRLKGALAPCGRPCCCVTHLQDFEKVNVRMAKNQGLSLNPTKISGVCGKIMCCLKYENEYYAEANKLMPKIGAEITTPNGIGTVYSVDLLKMTVRARVALDDAHEIKEYGIADIVLNESDTLANVVNTSSPDEQALKKLEDK